MDFMIQAMTAYPAHHPVTLVTHHQPIAKHVLIVTTLSQ